MKDTEIDMRTRRTAAMRTAASRRRAFVRGPDATAGNVTIEMALLLTFLLILVLGAYDFGRLALTKSEVTNAARAGAQFAVLDQTNADDDDRLIQAARDEANDVYNELVITPTNFCRCPGSSASVDCSTTCADGGYTALYVQVTVQDEMELLFTYPGIDDVQTLSSTSILRVR